MSLFFKEKVEPINDEEKATEHLTLTHLNFIREMWLLVGFVSGLLVGIFVF